jgi:hypothetical protein
LKNVQHELPSLKCTKDECLADFVLRKNARLNNPGACSLEFQSVMQILTECMLKWDIKSKSSTGKGILGTVRAFAGANEEQGRKTLHWHWQIWVEEINQSLRNALFDKDNNTRNKARQTFQEHIDNLISTSYGPQFCVTHKCKDDNDQETLKNDIPKNIQRERSRVFSKS